MPRSTARLLVELLESYGVSHVFGIPGVHNLELYRALAGSKLTHVLPRHEQAAGFMADGFARASGRPAACFAITGPGLANLATALGTAHADSVPMLVFATVLESRDRGLGRGRLHEIRDQRSVVASMSGLCDTALVPEAVVELLARAFARFAVERPRPAVIELPIDLLAAETAAEATAIPPPRPPAPVPQAVEEVARMLGAAERPALLLGGGALCGGARWRGFVERWGLPAVTTVAAKGLLPEDHPLTLGATLACAATRRWLAGRDIVLVVGSELAETDFWHEPVTLGRRRIRIDLDPDRLADSRHPAELSLRADAGTFLEALMEREPRRRSADRDLAALRAAALAEVAPGSRRAAAIAALRRALPQEALLFTDMTRIAYAANALFPVEVPRRFFHATGFGTLGWALPAAIGAAFARPSAPVVALVGDYGLQFSLAELGTAVEHGLPLLVVVWNDRGLGQIREEMLGRGMEPLATTLRSPDLPALAAAFGMAGRRVATARELEAAVAVACARRAPSLIEVCATAFTHG